MASGSGSSHDEDVGVQAKQMQQKLLVREAIMGALHSWPEAELSHRELAAIGERAGRAASARVALAAATAGSVNAEQAADLLGVESTQAVYQRAKRFGLLEVDQDGRKVYPAWQFDPDDGRVRPVVAEVLKVWRRAQVTHLTVLSWFTTPQQELFGARPVELLEDPLAYERVLVAARYAAAPFAH